MGKLYERAYRKGLTHSEIIKSYSDRFFTREEWEGVHFLLDEDYYIITKDREIIKNPKEIYNLDSDDWCLVVISDECLRIFNTIGGTEGVSYYA